MIGQATCIVVAEAHARVLRIAIGKLLSVVRASWSAVKGRGTWFTGIFVVCFRISHYSTPCSVAAMTSGSMMSSTMEIMRAADAMSNQCSLINVVASVSLSLLA